MVDDIAQWLGRLGLGQYAQAFVDNDIEFDLRSKLPDDDLNHELQWPIGGDRYGLGAQLSIADAMAYQAGFLFMSAS